jgi:uncharacterized protein YgiM (DUF1202 family)
MLRILPLYFLIFAYAIAQKPMEEKSFTAFSGKVLGYKVRLRTKPDLESPIIAQLNKNDLLLIVGEENDFWKAQPPSQTNLYVFRSYVIDDTVEANRVNIRLLPNTESPIIGQLQKGQKITGSISKLNNKWFEITPPKNTVFYIAKEFVGYAGNSSYIVTMQKKTEEVKELLSKAYLYTEQQCKKPFNKMNPDKAIVLFEKIIENYSEFEEYVQQAKEGLSLLQDSYLQKKIAFLETKANITTAEKKELASTQIPSTLSSKQTLSTKMEQWKPIEQSLFQKWSSFHPNKTMNDFYKEQKINSIAIQGTVQKFQQDIHHKPGDYILVGNNTPIGYLYSTMIDLEKLEGKKVTLHVSPRSNHHFAFPAYFVLESIE